MRTRKAHCHTDSGGLCDSARRRGAAQRGRDFRGLAERDQASRKERGRGAGKGRPFLAQRAANLGLPLGCVIGTSSISPGQMLNRG